MAGLKIRAIEKAIREEKYQSAEELLSNFKTEIEGGRAYDLLDHRPRFHKLNAMLQREKRITQLNKSVEQYNVGEARKTLTELIDQKLISKKEAENLDLKIWRKSEEGLLAAIISGEKTERRFFSEKFLEVYPSSKEKRRVIEDLIVGRFSDLTNAPEQKLSSDDLYETAHDLTKLLQKYTEEELNLSTVINVDELNNSINEYLKILKHKRDSKKAITQGDLVRFVENNRWWVHDYLAQRNNNYPLGSVGRVQEKLSNNWIYVCFDKSATWKKTFDCLKDKNANTAAYTLKELQPVEPANEIDKNHVRLELSRIKELFQEHYTERQEPVKKRHNPEVIDKVLPRSD